IVECCREISSSSGVIDRHHVICLDEEATDREIHRAEEHLLRLPRRIALNEDLVVLVAAKMTALDPVLSDCSREYLGGLHLRWVPRLIRHMEGSIVQDDADAILHAANGSNDVGLIKIIGKHIDSPGRVAFKFPDKFEQKLVRIG